MAVAVGLDKALDKAYEGKGLGELLDAPVAALAGVSAGDAEHLAAAFGIKTVRDLGTNKYFLPGSRARRAEFAQRLIVAAGPPR